ncbi:MAG TPA: sulfite exporter TauE/SafE family protein [Acidimicrobiales bacterium]|nr:sulfite exporter TauE/SafE family protein [Acidimicrobiales bacterium]
MTGDDAPATGATPDASVTGATDATPDSPMIGATDADPTTPGAHDPDGDPGPAATGADGTAASASTAKIVLVGLAAGFLSGLFGVGGGVLMVPALVIVLHMGQRLAHGTSLAAIVPIAAAGVAGYALEGEIDWAAALFLIIGSAGLGARIGTHLLHVLPQRALALVFACVLLVTAVRMVFDTSDAAGRPDLTLGSALALVLVGVVAGITAGLLGVGGGVIMVPAMVLLVGIPGAVAKGSSLAVIIPTALVGTQRNLKKHNADLRAAAIVGCSGVVSSFLASQISVGLDEQFSNRLFAALIAFVSLKMLWDNRRPVPAH